MLLEPVVRQFAQFARLDEESAAPWVPLCEAAAAWIESMRKPVVPPEGESLPAGGGKTDEGMPPEGEEVPPIEDGTSPAGEEKPPTGDGTPPEEGEKPPAGDGTPPESEAPEPADDPRLVLAAAGEAFYQYSLVSSGGEAQSLKIGDISISESSGNGGSSGARTLRDLLLAKAAGRLEPGFAGLWQVEGGPPLRCAGRSNGAASRSVSLGMGRSSPSSPASSPGRIPTSSAPASRFSTPGSDGRTPVSSIITVRLTGVGNWSRAAPSSRPQQPAISW